MKSLENLIISQFVDSKQNNPDVEKYGDYDFYDKTRKNLE